MTTYRDLLTPLFGADALREAEARVYDRESPPDAIGRYQCANGYCALGIMVRAAVLDYDGVDDHFPLPRILEDAIDMTESQADALDLIVDANDSGQLGRPGTLTALLDSAVLS